MSVCSRGPTAEASPDGQASRRSTRDDSVWCPANVASCDFRLHPSWRGPGRGIVRSRALSVRLAMVTIHISISIDTGVRPDSATALGERLKDLVWKEVYENMRLPASVATSYAEVS